MGGSSNKSLRSIFSGSSLEKWTDEFFDFFDRERKNWNFVIKNIVRSCEIVYLYFPHVRNFYPIFKYNDIIILIDKHINEKKMSKNIFREFYIEINMK